MAFRFQKRIKIMPGVRVNLSKTGVSTSVGAPGATVNVGKKGVKATAGIPGTGLSHQTQIGAGGKGAKPEAAAQPATKSRRGIWIILTLAALGAILWLAS